MQIISWISTIWCKKIDKLNLKTFVHIDPKHRNKKNFLDKDMLF